MSSSYRKYNEWAKKINDSLTKNKPRELASQCKYLTYWHQKIGEEDKTLCLQLEPELKKLLQSVAMKLLDKCVSDLNEARKHKVNSKVRFGELFSSLYNYQHNTHPLLMKTNSEQLAYDYINAFNNEFLDEIMGNVDQANTFQVSLMLEYFDGCEEVGIKVRGGYKTVLQVRKIGGIYKPRPDLSEFILNLATINLYEGRVIQAAVILCEALRTFIHFLSDYSGAAIEGELHESKPEKYTSFSEWLMHLKSDGIITADEVTKFTIFNTYWYEKLGELDYIRPDTEVVERAIYEVRQFIEENWNKVIVSSKSINKTTSLPI